MSNHVRLSYHFKIDIIHVSIVYINAFAFPITPVIKYTQVLMYQIECNNGNN